MHVVHKEEGIGQIEMPEPALRKCLGSKRLKRVGEAAGICLLG